MASRSAQNLQKQISTRSTRFWVGLLTALAVTLTTVAIAPALAVPSYPSWAEVQAAKKKVSAKKAMIKRLEEIIAAQQVVAEKLGKEALIKGEAFNQAQDAVDAVASKVKTLQSQVDDAAKQATTAQRQLGQIAAQMYRDGASGTSMNLLLEPGNADNLLYRLGAQDKVAQQSDTIYQRAIEKQKYAQSLTDQLKVAKDELAVKAADAQTKFDAARSAANTVQAEVDASNARNKVFYAQLAELQNTSADLERQRAEGLAAEARQNAGKTLPDAPELYKVNAPDTGKVSVAINFAKQQLGERYVLGGIGPNVWDCSGITKAAYAAAGVYIGTHSATNQFRTLGLQRKLLPVKEAVAGDLMWYTLPGAGFNGDKYHVVIYLGGGMMLEAPNPARTVRIVPLRYGELFAYAGRPTA
ncbi:MAG: NlpC/P60 family protein [Micrococcales bacterium]